LVKGIDKFREHFAGHEEQYALIGGAACDLLFGEAGLPFRATKDLDMVLSVEVVDAQFAITFAEFLESGGYQAREKSDGEKEFFRFHQPTDGDYPFMIELFSRQPAGLVLPDHVEVTRLTVEDDIISLSAILLDDDYYAALKKAKTIIEGVSILDESILIPFKARAFLDLTERKANDGAVKGRDIKKHRNDVFRLLQLISQDHRIEVAQPISADLARFVESVEDDESVDPKLFGVDFTRTEGLELLKSAYGLESE
jgi:hypothetical protein